MINWWGKQSSVGKELILVLVIVGMLVGIMSLFFRHLILDEFDQLDVLRTTTRARVAQQLLDHELGAINVLAKDWSLWDEIYDFALGTNAQFESDYLSKTQLDGLSIALIMVLDSEGQLVGGGRVESEAEELQPIAEQILAQATSSSLLVREILDQPKAGKEIMWIEGKPLMLGSHSLLKSNGEGPVAGVVVMGRWLTEEKIKQWEKLVSGPIQIRAALSDNNSATSIHEDGVSLEVANETELVAIGGVYDSRRRLIFEFMASSQREGHATGLTLFHYLIGLMTAVLIVAGLLIWTGWRRIRFKDKQIQLTIEKQMMEVERKNLELVESKKLVEEKNKQLEQNKLIGEQTKLAMMNILEDERELEDRLREEKANVEQTVAERTRELIEEQAKLEGSIDSLPVGYLMIDKAGNVVMVNKAARKIMKGVEREGMIGRVKEWLKENHDVSLDDEVGLPENPVFMGGIAYGENYVDLSVVPIQVVNDLTNDEVRIGWVTLIADVTEAKNLQKSRDDFFNIASHELRTPLTAIRGNTALIKDYYPEIMKDESVHQIIDDIHGASVRLISIVNDFLDASRLELKKIEFKIEKFDMVPLLTKVVAAIEPTAREKSIGWELRLGEIHELQVMADVARTEQVLYNLMGNAQKFTKEGGVIIELKQVNDVAEIWITDTGLGIPAENQRLLFRKFQQAGESVFTREASQGSGMGLYISRLLVEGMGGNIRLESSELGKGSTFVLTLSTG